MSPCIGSVRFSRSSSSCSPHTSDSGPSSERELDMESQRWYTVQRATNQRTFRQPGSGTRRVRARGPAQVRCERQSATCTDQRQPSQNTGGLATGEHSLTARSVSCHVWTPGTSHGMELSGAATLGRGENGNIVQLV